MKFWRSFKNIYGVFMGTSTDYLKPTKRPLWPTKMHDIDKNFSVFLGGTGNCGVLRNGDKTLLINCNSGKASDELFNYSEGSQKTLIITSNFSDYVEGVSGRQIEMVYGAERSSFWEEETQVVDGEMEIPWGEESIVLVPIEGAFSKKDLVVYLKNRKTLFLGGLFYNRIHPILDSQRGLNAEKWIQVLDQLKKRFNPKTVVPHEGDLCGLENLENFTSYLKALSDQEVEFSYCRKNFDWSEIPGYTSLEENFDQIRNS